MYSKSIEVLLRVFGSTINNECVVDHVLVILCLVAKCHPEVTASNLDVMFNMEYHNYIINSLIRLVEEPTVIQVIITSTQRKGRRKCLYRLVVGTISSYSKEILEELWNKESIMADKESLPSIKNKAYEKVFTGTIFLLSVFYIVLEYRNYMKELMMNI
jgi:hypothetical protein